MGRFVDWVNARTAKSTTIAGTELLYIDDSGTSKKATLSDAVRYTLANAYSGLAMAVSGNWTLSTPMYEDLNFPIIPRATGSNITTYTAIDAGGFLTYPQWEVNDYNVCDSNEMPHCWKEGTQISWHLHMITNGSNVDIRYTKWELIWALADINGVWTDQTTITTADIAIPANTATKTHLLVPLGNVTLTGSKIGAQVYPRLKRVASSGNAPSANPWVTMLQAHIQVDTLGSTGIGTK